MATTKQSTTPSGDRRVRRTRAALARALIQLVGEHDLARISVSDVAEAAGVSRSAFYDHYRDVHELAEAACTAMIDGLIESVPARPGSADLAQEATGSLTAFFANLAEHAGLYRALLGPQGSARVIDHIRGRIAATIQEHLRRLDAGEPSGAVGSLPDAPHEVTASFTAGALVGVAGGWLQRGCPQPPAEIAALTLPLLNALYRIDAPA